MHAEIILLLSLINCFIIQSFFNAFCYCEVSVLLLYKEGTKIDKFYLTKIFVYSSVIIMLKWQVD